MIEGKGRSRYEHVHLVVRIDDNVAASESKT